MNDLYQSVSTSQYPLLNPPVPSESQVAQPPSLVSLYADQARKVPPAYRSEKSKSMSMSGEKRIGRLFRIAVFSTLAFFVLSQNVTYGVVNQLYTYFTQKHYYIVNEMGCPTHIGTLLHATLFFIGMCSMLIGS